MPAISTTVLTVIHCSIPGSTSSFPRTATANDGSSGKQATNSEIVRICLKRAIPIDAFLTTGGHFIKNERIPAAQCAGILSFLNLYLFQAPVEG